MTHCISNPVGKKKNKKKKAFPYLRSRLSTRNGVKKVVTGNKKDMC
jgi:hypothetical protein